MSLNKVMAIDIEALGNSFPVQVGLGFVDIRKVDFSQDDWFAGELYNIDIPSAMVKYGFTPDPHELMFWLRNSQSNTWVVDDSGYPVNRYNKSIPNYIIRPFSTRLAYEVEITHRIDNKIIVNHIDLCWIEIADLNLAVKLFFEKFKPDIIVAHQFDFKVLDNAWRKLNQGNPLSYKRRMDLGTLTKIFKRQSEIFKNEKKHDAIHDVMYQLSYIVPMIKQLKEIKNFT